MQAPGRIEYIFPISRFDIFLTLSLAELPYNLQPSFQFFGSATQHDHFSPLLIFVNPLSTMTHRCTTQPRRTSIHSCTRPKSSSVRDPERNVYTGPHQTDRLHQR